MPETKLDDISILTKLECKEYLNCRSDNLADIKQHITKFLTWFNEVARKCLLTCSPKEKDEYLFILVQLRRQISYSISALGNSPSNKRHEFRCGLCDEIIIIKPWQNIWDCLQNHSHFDQLCLNFLTQQSHMDVMEESQQKIENIDVKMNKLIKDFNEVDVACDSIKEENQQMASTSYNTSRQWYIEDLTQSSECSTEGATLTTSETVKVSSINGNIISEKSSDFLLGANKLSNNEELGKNHFAFNFEVKYDAIVEQTLYPKFYQKFKLDGDFIMQRTGSFRSVCLICCCELLMQRRAQNIVGHISGQKHSNKMSNETSRTCLKNYHESFYNLEPNLQAHQVYFLPDVDPSFNRCLLCTLFVKREDIVAHIMNEPHKSRVISLKFDPHVKNTFYLLEHHLEVYGLKNDVKSLKEQQTPVTNDDPGRHEKSGGRRRLIMGGVIKDADKRIHEIVKSIETPDDSNPINTLPRRFASHLNFLAINGTSIVCTACNTEKNNFSTKSIPLHLIQQTHLVATNLKLPDYIYFCEICDLKFHDERTWNLHFKKIPNKHENMAASRKDQVCEYECLTCKVILYGDKLSLSRHQNQYSRRIERKREIILPEDVKKYFSSKTLINQNGNLLLEDSLNVLNHQEDVIQCCQDMETALSIQFTDCKAYPFGSRISGLGSSDSDLDVFIDIGYMYDGVQKQDEQNQFEIIRTSLEIFRYSKKIFFKITSRPTARTPIIKLKHKPTNLDCDISFRHGLSVENTKFLRFCFELQPVAQKLILLLKKWLHLCSLTENITTYAIAMMAIFYLQSENYLISVDQLKQLNPNKNVIIDGWDTIAYTSPIEVVRTLVKTYDGDIVDLLKGFFKFYSEFEYKTKVICPLLGETIQKSQFTEDLKGGLLPDAMASYIRKINIEESPEYFRAFSEFCLQDPFDLSHNLTKACSTLLVEKFKKLCALSFNMINNLND